MAKILYVEDDEMNRDMLSRRLTRRDHEVLLAFDGQEGLEKMRKTRSSSHGYGIARHRWMGCYHSSQS